MSAPNIIPVTNKADKLRFIKSQWNFYKGDNSFVPPIIMDREKLLDEKKNPFYKHIVNEMPPKKPLKVDFFGARSSNIYKQLKCYVHC